MASHCKTEGEANYSWDIPFGNSNAVGDGMHDTLYKLFKPLRPDQA